MHLDARRYAEDRDPRADASDDVAGRAVAAGEEDQVDAALLELFRRSARVGRRRVRRAADVEHLGREAVRLRDVGAHARRRCHDLHLLAPPLEPCQGALGTLVRDRRRAAPERLAEGVGAVGSPQPDTAAEAGDRVDDQPQPRSHSELGGDVVDRAARQRDHLVQLGAGRSLAIDEKAW